MAEIRLENVQKRFGEVVVLEDLTLTVQDGEFFTFVGPSGCGKSTVLNLIAGLEAVSGGEVLCDGVPLTGRSPKERDVAMVFQNYALYPHMTVFENLAFPLRMKKEDGKKIVREVGRTADLLGLTDLLQRTPRELSGGQRQRVALGRAIVRRPKVFLMDEPLSNLDARLRVEMRAELKRLHRELAITTIYVTHDQAEALGLSRRMAVLHQGRVRQVGAPDQVYRRPADLFVAGFIGSPPMNLIPARVAGTDTIQIECLGRRFPTSLQERPHKEAVTAGIRPEDLSVAREGGENAIEATVLVVEPAGSVTWAEARWRDVVVRAAARPELGLQPEERVFLTVRTQDLVLFDADTGMAL
jgi:multiple sugar transport system ATP-binding protein